MQLENLFAMICVMYDIIRHDKVLYSRIWECWNLSIGLLKALGT